MSTEPGATLALHFGALGDFVLSWPALGLLSAGPSVNTVHLWGRPDWGRLIFPGDQVHDRDSARFGGLFSLEPDAALDEWLQGFKRAVVFAHQPPAELLAHLEQVVPQVWCIATRPPQGKRLHVGDWQVDQLRELGLTGPAQAPPLRLKLPPEKRGAVLAPGSGGRDKRLIPELSATLARRLLAKGHRLTLLLGPAEDLEYRSDLVQALSGLDYDTVDSPAMADLVGLLAGSALYVGADSGVSHLAAAIGAPCLALFQASDPRVWGPRGPRAAVVTSSQAPYIGLDPPQSLR